MTAAPTAGPATRQATTAMIIGAITTRCKKWTETPTRHTSLAGKQLASKIIAEDIPTLIAIAGQASRPQAAEGDLLRLLHHAIRASDTDDMISMDEPIKAGDAVRLAYAALIKADYTAPAPESRRIWDA